MTSGSANDCATCPPYGRSASPPTGVSSTPKQSVTTRSSGTPSSHQLTQPTVIDGQRVAGLRFGDPRAHALLAAIAISRLQPDGFANHHLREHLAPLLGLRPDQLSAGRMTYDLRRLRLHGLIERIPHTHRYRPTPLGWRTAWFYTHAYNRFLRTGTAHVADRATTATLRRALDDFATRSGIPA